MLLLTNGVELWLYSTSLSLNSVIIFFFRQQSRPDRPVSAAPNTPFKGLPSRLRPFSLPFSTVLAILLLFILVTCRSQYVLYLLSLSSSASSCSSTKISSFLL
jgi:hypothetical protein